MNRVKKEIRRKGIRLECDYPWLPYYIKGNSPFEPSNICLGAVVVKSETAEIYEYLNVIVSHYRLSRNGNLEEIFDD